MGKQSFLTVAVATSAVIAPHCYILLLVALIGYVICETVDITISEIFAEGKEVIMHKDVKTNQSSNLVTSCTSFVREVLRDVAKGASGQML